MLRGGGGGGGGGGGQGNVYCQLGSAYGGPLSSNCRRARTRASGRPISAARSSSKAAPKGSVVQSVSSMALRNALNVVGPCCFRFHRKGPKCLILASISSSPL